MGLKVEIKSERGTFVDLTIRSIIKEVAEYAEELGVCSRAIEHRIATVRTGNHFKASHLYKVLYDPTNRKVEVWHLDISGEQNRLIAVVTKDAL